jgi:H+/Cl- antiporter ClcA
MGKSFNGPLLTFPKVEAMDEKTSRLIEYVAEAVLVAWLSYLFFYQNYLLYHWHRGLPLPSKVPSVVAGIAAGVLLFLYEWFKFQKELEKNNVATDSAVPLSISAKPDRKPSGEENSLRGD